MDDGSRAEPVHVVDRFDLKCDPSFPFSVFCFLISMNELSDCVMHNAAAW